MNLIEIADNIIVLIWNSHISAAKWVQYVVLDFHEGTTFSLKTQKHCNCVTSQNVPCEAGREL